MSKNCPKCGVELKDTAKFCFKCGCNVKQYEEQNQTVFCSECGAKCESGALFCSECGATIETNNETQINNNFNTSTDGFDGWGEALKKINEVEENDKFIDFEYKKMPNGKIVIQKLIDEYAFDVVIPNGVTAIGDGAFENSGVVTVTLPDGVTAIGKRAFAECKSLESLNLPSSLVKVDDEAFLNCERLEVTMPNTVKIVGNKSIIGTKTDILAKQAEEKAKREAEEKKRAEEEAKKKAELESKYKVGGNYILGSYYQTDSYSKTPIEWRILAKDGDKALLISKYVIDRKLFDKSTVGVNWGNCELRKWLNEEFINTAFNTFEREKIVETEVNTASNPKNPTYRVNATRDKVFLLSIDEVEKYFSSSELMKCKCTRIAKEYGAFCDSDAFAYWWLRTPGDSSSRVSYVFYTGGISIMGYSCDGSIFGVRPAMWVSLK